LLQADKSERERYERAIEREGEEGGKECESVCVCVREREREGERERERERER
jgi:hypothetical protein